MKKNKILVSIDNYLDNEISAGPKASKGTINFHYQHYENVFNFFSLIIMKRNKETFLCLPKYRVKWDNFIVRSAIVFNIKENKYWIPPKARRAIDHCKDNNIRFIYSSLILIWAKNKISHANMLIIDIKKNTIERFEPYGWTVGHSATVNAFIKNVVRLHLGLENMKYIPPEQLSTKLGVQYFGDSYEGMCVTICMLYLHLRILNSDASQKSVINSLMKLKPLELKKLILRYAKYVENLLKKYDYEVNLLNEETYRI